MKYSADYSTLLNLFIQLVQSQADKDIAQGDEWLNDAQTLSIKLFRHLISMQTLAAGSTVERDDIPILFFIDHSSVKVVARAALETYLVFFFLYGSSDKSLSKFRHKTWQLGGLMDRQTMHASNPKNRKKLSDEKILSEEIKLEIQNSFEFQSYSAKQQQKLLLGDWRVGKSWIDLGVEAGFHQQYFKEVYGYLCGYSHSSYLSALQVGEANSIDSQKLLTRGILGIGLVIMAHHAFSYSSAFNLTETLLSKNIAAKKTADVWRFEPEDMDILYK